MQKGDSVQQERHVFLVETQPSRAFVLEAATYSIGRDVTNAIVINEPSVSRQHALLLRLPIPGTQLYRYRLVDGNAQGKPSVNGILVNGQRCSSCELKNGDLISFGTDVQATYLKVEMATAAFVEYLEAIQFHSIKSGPISPKETMVATLGGADLEAELDAVRLAEHRLMTVDSAHGAPTVRGPRPSKLPGKTRPSSQAPAPFQHWWGLILAILLVSGLGIWQLSVSSNPNPAESPTSTEPSS